MEDYKVPDIPKIAFDCNECASYENVFKTLIDENKELKITSKLNFENYKDAVISLGRKALENIKLRKTIKLIEEYAHLIKNNNFVKDIDPDLIKIVIADDILNIINRKEGEANGRY